MSKVTFYSDEWTLEDNLAHVAHVKDVGEMVKHCNPPYVACINGDWGTGKTSFLRKLHLYLAVNDSNYPKARSKWTRYWGQSVPPESDRPATVWFDAWRYQHETNPVNALLSEIRAHFSWKGNLKGKTGKMTYAALMSIGEISKKIGISPEKIVAGGEKWEQDHMLTPLPSQLCRDLLDDAVGELLKATKKSRLIIFIDDLDRCRADVAFQFLEAIKVYLSISKCIFVLALDMRQVRQAVAGEMRSRGLIIKSDNESQKKNDDDIYAASYLGKLFQSIYHLPGVTDPADYFDSLLKSRLFRDDRSSWVEIIKEYDLLPPNPRKIKFFVNGLTLYLNQLPPNLRAGNEDHYKIVLILTYLRVMANDIYRILENWPDFWERLVAFCRNPVDEDHEALKKYALPEKAEEDSTGDFTYYPAYPDPAEENIFRAAGLIREWRLGAGPTDDEIKAYMLRTPL